VKADDAEIVAAMTAISDEFEAYGYRRVGAELRHRGMIVNSKKIRRLMHEHDLRPKRYAYEPYRDVLAEYGLVGSMGRRGNP
jgi:hypothetical protein